MSNSSTQWETHRLADGRTLYRKSRQDGSHLAVTVRRNGTATGIQTDARGIVVKRRSYASGNIAKSQIGR